MRRTQGIVVGALIVAALVGGSVAMASSKQTFKTSFTRGKGDALVLKVSSNKDISSYGFLFKKKYQKAYELTSAVLVKYNNTPVAKTSYFHEACTPATLKFGGLPQEYSSGPAMICGLSTGLPPNAKSLVIDLTSNKCLPNGVISGIAGPKGACKR